MTKSVKEKRDRERERDRKQREKQKQTEKRKERRVKRETESWTQNDKLKLGRGGPCHRHHADVTWALSGALMETWVQYGLCVAKIAQ